MDRLQPTTRLRAIDLSQYTAVDDLRDWQIGRVGLANKWFTKRNGMSYEWLSIENYMDVFFQDPEGNRSTSNFFTDITWRPTPWLTASTTAQVPVFGATGGFSEVQSSLSFMPTDKFQFSIGHYYLQEHPLIQRDANLLTFNTYSRLSDNWGFSTAHRYELRDSTLEYQQYTIHRDLGSWTASVGGIIRDNRSAGNEYGVVLSLTLKAFPQFSLPIDFQPGGED